jgi:2-keto-4-pentenoate hydratase
MNATAGDERIARGMQAQLAERRARIAAGDRAIGWKVGFSTPVMMERFKITAPLVGYMMQSGVVRSGGQASFGGCIKPGFEPEVAAHLGKDLAGGSDRATAAAAIAALSPAIELIDLTFPPQDVEAILKANVFHRGLVLGPRSTAHAGGDFKGLVGTVRRNGTEMARITDLQTAVGNIPDVVRFVADTLAAAGQKLAAGEVVITGSVTVPVFVEPGETGAEFTLDPIGSVTVRYSV